MHVLAFVFALLACATAHDCHCDGDLGLYSETNEIVACDESSIDCSIRSIRNRCCVTCDACAGHDDDDGECNGDKDVNTENSQITCSKLVFPGACDNPDVKKACCDSCGSGGKSSDSGSSSSSSGDDCFAGSEMILTNKGLMQVQDLQHHDDIEVEVVHEDGTLGFGPLQIWLHKSAGDAEYLEISTESGNTLVTTATHIVYTVPCEGTGHKTTGFAQRITPGDCVLTKQAQGIAPSRVTEIKSAMHAGRYAFTTPTGNVVVSNVVASAYSEVEFETLQHYFFQLMYYLQQMPGFNAVNSIFFPMARDAVHPIAEMLHHSYNSIF